MDFTNLPFAESELNKRALIWTMKLGRLAKTIFNNYLAHCEYDISSPSEVEKQKNFQNTVKEVLSVLIWLSIIQIKAKYTVGDWLKTLTLEAFAISDVMQPSPSSFDIMNKYNLTKDGLEATTKLSFDLCNQYGLGNSKPDALIYLSNELMNSKTSLEEIFTQIAVSEIKTLEASVQ